MVAKPLESQNQISHDQVLAATLAPESEEGKATTQEDCESHIFISRCFLMDKNDRYIPLSLVASDDKLYFVDGKSKLMQQH